MDRAFVAEDAHAYQDLARSVERDVRPEVVLIHGPTGDAWSNLAARVRFGHRDRNSVAVSRQRQRSRPKLCRWRRR
jgi:hypothetical protein